MKTLTILITALIFSACTKQLDESMLGRYAPAARIGNEKTPKPFSWHGTTNHGNGCVSHMYIWTTYGLVGYYMVTVYNYYVISTCPDESPISHSWTQSERESTTDETITELSKILPDVQIAEIFKTLKPKTVYFGMQSNGCGLYADVDYSVIIAGVLGVVSTEVYEVCNGVTTHLAFYYNLQWYREAASDSRLSDEQRLMIASKVN